MAIHFCSAQICVTSVVNGLLLKMWLTSVGAETPWSLFPFWAVLSRQLATLLPRLQLSPCVSKSPSEVTKPLLRVLLASGSSSLASGSGSLPTEPSGGASTGHSHRGALSCGQLSVSTGGPGVPLLSRAALAGSRLPLPVLGTCSSPRCQIAAHPLGKQDRQFSL